MGWERKTERNKGREIGDKGRKVERERKSDGEK